jgi:mRNA-degrading endonuclease RelE of RelBE toxin-antitoxin system
MEVKLHPEAQKYLDRLNEPYKGQLQGVIKKLSCEPPEGDIEPFQGKKGYWRVKAGRYRMLYKIVTEVVKVDGKDTKTDKIFITHIDPRGQVYNKKNKRR